MKLTKAQRALMLQIDRAPFHALDPIHLPSRKIGAILRLETLGCVRLGPRGWVVTSRGSTAIGTFDAFEALHTARCAA